MTEDNFVLDFEVGETNSSNSEDLVFEIDEPEVMEEVEEELEVITIEDSPPLIIKSEDNFSYLNLSPLSSTISNQAVQNPEAKKKKRGRPPGSKIKLENNAKKKTISKRRHRVEDNEIPKTKSRSKISKMKHEMPKTKLKSKVSQMKSKPELPQAIPEPKVAKKKRIFEVPEIPEAKSRTDNYFCPKCFYTSKNHNGILDHMKQNKHLFQYICFYCDEFFAFKCNVEKHYKDNHVDKAQAFREFNKVDLKKECQFVCSLCLSPGKSLQEIKTHGSRVHKDVKESYFIQLDIKYDSPRIDEAEPCYYGDVEKKPLKFPCTYCRMAYDNESSLKDHCANRHPNNSRANVAIASGRFDPIVDRYLAPQYLCLLCDSAFNKVDNMNAHYLTHCTYKPYAYIRLASNNEPTLVEVPTYTCSECDKHPNTYKEMSEHWKTAHLGKPLKLTCLYPKKNRVLTCPHCQVKFAYKKLKELHIKFKHPENIKVLQYDADAEAKIPLETFKKTTDFELLLKIKKLPVY